MGRSPTKCGPCSVTYPRTVLQRSEALGSSESVIAITKQPNTPLDMHRQTRHCLNCGLKEERKISSLDAAFEHSRAWDAPCPNCGSTKQRGGAVETPALSAEQLAIWAGNKDIVFDSQDEDILLARPESLNLLLQYLDDTHTLKSKRKTLLAALFVIIYDHLPPKRNDPLLVGRVASALRERKGVIAELGTRHIAGRILSHVSPVVGEDALAKIADDPRSSKPIVVSSTPGRNAKGSS